MEIDDLEEIEKEIAQKLKKQLSKINTGKEDENKFQDFCIGALEFIFYPDFIEPKKEERIHNGRKRIDINPEIDQLSGRFSPIRGKFGIMLARQFDNRELFIKRCQDTLNDARGLVIPIVDEDIIKMLTLIENNERNKIEEYLYGIYSEIIN